MCVDSHCVLGMYANCISDAIVCVGVVCMHYAWDVCVNGWGVNQSCAPMCVVACLLTGCRCICVCVPGCVCV